MRLDKKYFTKQSFEHATEQQSHYRRMNSEDLSAAFLFMMQAAFGFTDLPWPRMNKQVFEKRKRG